MQPQKLPPKIDRLSFQPIDPSTPPAAGSTGGLEDTGIDKWKCSVFWTSPSGQSRKGSGHQLTDWCN